MTAIRAILPPVKSSPILSQIPGVAHLVNMQNGSFHTIRCAIGFDIWRKVNSLHVLPFLFGRTACSASRLILLNIVLGLVTTARRADPAGPSRESRGLRLNRSLA